jgi:hypothetical protein
MSISGLLISNFGPLILIPISAFFELKIWSPILILLKFLSISIFLFEYKSPPPEGRLNLAPLISNSGPFPSILGFKNNFS